MSELEGKAMSLRFPIRGSGLRSPPPAKAAGMSMQQYILTAAYDRATAVETAFLEAFDAAVARYT